MANFKKRKVHISQLQATGNHKNRLCYVIVNIKYKKSNKTQKNVLQQG